MEEVEPLSGAREGVFAVALDAGCFPVCRGSRRNAPMGLMQLFFVVSRAFRYALRGSASVLADLSGLGLVHSVAHLASQLGRMRSSQAQNPKSAANGFGAPSLVWPCQEVFSTNFSRTNV